jgi:hypothetical protein
MILMGEVRRTQGGNNNAYCQDTETSWFDWTLSRSTLTSTVRTPVLAGCWSSAEPRVPPNSSSANRTDLARRAAPPVRLTTFAQRGATLRLPDTPFLFHVIVNAYREPLGSSCVDCR